MTDQIRGLNGALAGAAYRDRPTDDLGLRIVAGEYIGRHEGELDDNDRPSGPARYAKPGAAVFDLLKRRHLRLAQRRILNAVRRSQP